jgi:phytoene synthase
MSVERTIFQRASTTYYFSSKFFPARVRQDVFRLYSFVRVADNYVDDIPHQPRKLRALERRWRAAYANKKFDTDIRDSDDIDVRVVKNIVYVARKYEFDPVWVDDFLKAMKMDITSRRYRTLADTLAYVHGSAEVIGLMMAKILDLPESATQAAVMQGRAMQFINFIRDIAEDNALERCYFPTDDLKKFGLKDLREPTARANPEAFQEFIAYQLKRYSIWQSQATDGFPAIPKRYRIPIRTAVDMYNWTAAKIEADPFIVYDKKVKPSKHRVMRRAAVRAMHG